MGAQDNKSSKKSKVAPVRLYQKGIFTGFRRSQRLQHSGQALIHVQGCVDRASSKFYHGNNGGVSVAFAKNLPPRAMGMTVRVMLYPNKQIELSWTKRCANASESMTPTEGRRKGDTTLTRFLSAPLTEFMQTTQSSFV